MNHEPTPARWLLFAVVLPLVASPSIVSAEGVNAPLSDQVEISADEITLDEQGVAFAKGHVRLETEKLSLQAESLTLDHDKGTIEASGPLDAALDTFVVHGRSLEILFAPPALRIEDPEFTLHREAGRALSIRGRSAHCADGACIIDAATGTACPHEPPGYRIVADQVVVNESGDVDLDWPVLMLDDTPVLAAPWLRVRPPGKSGFLPPRLGWDREGGLIVGPAGLVAISRGVEATGHVAARTSQGMEASSRLLTPNTDLNIEYLLDDLESHGRTRVSLSPPLDGASLASDVDLVDNREMIDAFAQHPLERAATHTSSRLLVSTPGDEFLLENAAGIIQTFDERGRADQEALYRQISLSLAVPDRPLADAIWAGGVARLDRFASLSPSAVISANGTWVQPLTRITLAPALSLPSRVGPIAIEAAAASLHRFWLPDGAPTAPASSHLVSTVVDASLPLEGRLLRLRHEMAPTIRYRLTPFLRGSEPYWVADDLDRLKAGHGLEIGGTTDLGREANAPLARLGLFERLDLPGFDATAGMSYLHASASAGPAWLSVSVEAVWDHEESLPPLASASVMSSHGEANSLEIGARWLAPGRSPLLDRPWSLAAGPWIGASWPDEPARSLELLEQASASLTTHVVAHAGARVGIWPTGSLHALWYGIEWRSRCGCIAIGLAASHRLNSAVPDVWATVGLDAASI